MSHEHDRAQGRHGLSAAPSSGLRSCWLLGQAPPPRGAPARGAGAEVRSLLDEAHAALGAGELAEVLLGTRRSLRPLRAGLPPGGVPAGARESAPARAHLRRIRAALYLSARSSGPHAAEDLAALGRETDAYLEEVACRPRGCVAGPRRT